MESVEGQVPCVVESEGKKKRMLWEVRFKVYKHMDAWAKLMMEGWRRSQWRDFFSLRDTTHCMHWWSFRLRVIHELQQTLSSGQRLLLLSLFRPKKLLWD